MTKKTYSRPYQCYSGQVASCREKYGHFGPFFGIVLKLGRGKDCAKVWFRRSLEQQDRRPVRVGDLVTVEGLPGEMSEDGGLLFLKKAKVLGDIDCGHGELKVTSDGSYACAGCGGRFAVELAEVEKVAAGWKGSR